MYNKLRFVNVPYKNLDQPSDGGPLLVLMLLDPEHIIVVEHPDVLHLFAPLIRDPKLAILICPKEVSATRLIAQQLHCFLKLKTQ